MTFTHTSSFLLLFLWISIIFCVYNNKHFFPFGAISSMKECGFAQSYSLESHRQSVMPDKNPLFMPKIQVSVTLDAATQPGRLETRHSKGSNGQSQDRTTAMAGNLRPVSASTASRVRLVAAAPIRTHPDEIVVRKHVRNLSLPPSTRQNQDLAAVTLDNSSLSMSTWNVQEQNLSPSRFTSRSRYSEYETSTSVSSCSYAGNPVAWSIHSQSSLQNKLDSLASPAHYRAKRKMLWWKRVKSKLQVWKKKRDCQYSINPLGIFFHIWCCLVSLCVLYNAISIPLRFSFDIYSTHFVWLVLDYLLADVIYFLDVVLVSTHLHFQINDRNLKQRVRYYFCHRPWAAVADFLSLLPLDILYAVPILRYNSLLRLPRLLKVHVLLRFHYQLESRTSFPNFYRVAKLLLIFIYIVHIYACIYYLVSRLEGLGSNGWVYNGQGIAYLRCFYVALLTVSNIHELEMRMPATSVEFAADIIGYMFGLFILAVIIGELRQVADELSSHQQLIKGQLEQLKLYMNHWKLPERLRTKIQVWHEFALTQEMDINEGDILKFLPRKLKSDLAIQVHFETLRKVAFFQGCEAPLLRELILKLKPALYLPGDFICKKGDIGREMYIVNRGFLEVLGGREGGELLAKLGPGSTFGEISLLSVSIGRRRTATVRTLGFAALFVLSKADLDRTLEDYPQTQFILQTKALTLLQQDKERREREREEREREEGERGGERGETREVRKEEVREEGKKRNGNESGREIDTEGAALVPPSEALSSSSLFEGSRVTLPPLIKTAATPRRFSKSNKVGPASHVPEPAQCQSVEPASRHRQSVESISRQHQSVDPAFRHRQSVESISRQHQSVEPAFRHRQSVESISRQHQSVKPAFRNHQSVDSISRQHQSVEPTFRHRQSVESISRQHQSVKPAFRNHQSVDSISRQHQSVEPAFRHRQSVESISRQHQSVKPAFRNHQSVDSISRQHQSVEPAFRHRQSVESISRQHQTVKAASRQSVELASYQQQSLEPKSNSKHLVHVDVHVEPGRERQEKKDRQSKKNEPLEHFRRDSKETVSQNSTKRSSIPSTRMRRNQASRQSQIFIAADFAAVKSPATTGRTNRARTSSNPLPACSKEISVLISSCSSSSD